MMRRFVYHRLALIGAALLTLFAAVKARADASVSTCTEGALRDAIAIGGVVTFEVDCTFTLSDVILITTNVTLDASGQSITISGNSSTPLFRVAAHGSLELDGLTLTDGQSETGGAVYVEASGSLTASECIFMGNHANGTVGVNGANGSSSSGTGSNGRNGTSGGSGWGGAIYNAGDLTLSSCQFLTNSAAGGNGGNGGNGGDGGFQGGNGGNAGNGATGLGGAIYDAGTSLDITDCTFETNAVFGGNGGIGGTNGAGPFPGLAGTGGAGAAGSGAAIFTVGENVTIANSTFSDNVAGGGNSAAGGTLSNNNGSNGARGGDSAGGGIYNGGTNSLQNCTFFNNRVKAGNGGNGGNGSFTAGNGGNGGNGTGGGLCNSNEITVINCTFASCAAVGGTNGVAGSGAFAGSNGSPGKGRGGGLAQGAGTFSLVNTLLSTNNPGTNIAKLAGTFTDDGHNLSSDSSYNFTGTSFKNKDPKLGPLADNGGVGENPPLTMALKPGSPALDAGDDSAAPDTDERGFPRPVGARSDIGAFELSFVIDGRVTTGTNGLAGVLITAGARSTITGSNGNYTLDAFGTNLVVTASLTNYFFTPSSQTVNATSDRSGIDFQADPPYTIGGQVLGAAGTITVRIGTNVVTAGTNGNYSLSNLRRGAYVVTPTADGFQFAPASVTVTVGPSTNTVNFFALFQISGRVLNGTNGLAGVTVSADAASSVTDSNGFYTIPRVPAGDYFVTAALTGFNFGPSPEVIVGPNASNVNFSVVQPKFTVSGRVTYGTNGLGAVRIFGSQTTDASGNFSLSLVADTYTFTPVKPGYLFRPRSQTIVLTTNVSGVDFAAGAEFNSMHFTNGSLLLSLAGPSLTTRIQASTNLVDWITIFTGNPPFQFLDTNSSEFSQRFYRSVQP